MCVGVEGVVGGKNGVSLGKTRAGLRLLRASILHSTQQDAGWQEIPLLAPDVSEKVSTGSGDIVTGQLIVRVCVRARHLVCV